MALSRDIVIRLLGDADSAVKAQKAAADAAGVSAAAYRKAEREHDRVAKASQTAARKQREAMAETSQNAVILGGVMVAAFGIAVNAAMDFDKAMSAVGAASMAGAADLEKLRDAALEAGRTTAYSATEAARAQTELAKAGLSTADILGGALTGALDLAAAGQMDVAAAAEIAATALEGVRSQRAGCAARRRPAGGRCRQGSGLGGRHEPGVGTRRRWSPRTPASRSRTPRARWPSSPPTACSVRMRARRSNELLVYVAAVRAWTVGT